MIEAYNKLENKGKKLGLEVKKEKRKYMKMDWMNLQSTAMLIINNELV